MNSCESPIVNEYLDDRAFKFQVFLWNNDGKAVRLPKSTIQELVINDNILTWYQTGHMIFSNPKDVMERVTKKYDAHEEIDIDPFRFRNDGRDFIYIEIDVPVEDDILSKETLNVPTYTLKFLGSIYDVQDIAGGKPDDKVKKVKFWDYRQQLMVERNMMWSTAGAVKRQGYTGSRKSQYLVTDQTRTVYTGDAIKDLITECLKTEQLLPKFAEDFSIGGERLFYTSPVDSKVSDNLKYLMSHHVHDEKNAEPCILRCDPYTDIWSLLPITEYFNRAYTPENQMPGEFLRDRFYIGDESLKNEVSTNTLRTPQSQTAQNNFWVDGNIINSYEFSEMSVQDTNDYINTTAVHMYDTKNKQFSIRIEDSDVENVKTYMEEKTFKNMLAGDKGNQAAFVLNKNKKENKNIMNRFTATASSVRDSLEGRNKTMVTAVFNGNVMKFVVRGLPGRQAGKFISIDRDGGYNENDYDDKILGLYFVTNITHIINNNGYHNEITAVKPYLYNKVDFNEDVP